MTPARHADLGGQLGHSPVVPEPEGELWHASWEPRALALTLAMGATGSWNIDISRDARETLPDYAVLSYYEIWIAALIKLLRERGMLADDEIAEGQALHAAPPVVRILQADQVKAVLARGASTLRRAPAAPRFALGDAVRTRAAAVPHHTRLPGYARGKRGIVRALLGTHVFADSHAQGLGEEPCPLYTVAFDGHELWGGESTERLVVSVDAWEPYLEPA